MELVFRLDLVIHPSDEVKAEDIGTFLLGMGLRSFLHPFHRISLKKADATKDFSTLEQIPTLLAEMGYGLFELAPDKTEEIPSRVNIFRLRNGMGIHIYLQVEQDQFFKTSVKTFLNCIERVYQEFSFRYEFSEDSRIAVNNSGFQRPFPEKSLEDWGENQIADIFWAFSAPWEDEEAEESDVDFLTKIKKLPAPVSYWIKGKLLVVNWLGDALDISKVNEALARREQWLNANFELPPEF